MRRIATLLVPLLVLGIASGCSDSDSGDQADSTTTTAESTGTSDTSSNESTTTTLKGGADSPEDAVTGYIEAAALDQWGRVYDGLHPDQRALFSKEEFVSCMDPIPGQFEGVKVVDTYEESSALAGVSESVPSTAVTMEITFEGRGTQNLTGHAYEVGGRWWSSVNEDAFDKCNAG